MHSHCGHHAIRAGKSYVVRSSRDVTGREDPIHCRRLELVRDNRTAELGRFDLAAKQPSDFAVEPIARADK
jgi:hypothetical protein